MILLLLTELAEIFFAVAASVAFVVSYRAATAVNQGLPLSAGSFGADCGQVTWARL